MKVGKFEAYDSYCPKLDQLYKDNDAGLPYEKIELLEERIKALTCNKVVVLYQTKIKGKIAEEMLTKRQARDAFYLDVLEVVYCDLRTQLVSGKSLRNPPVTKVPLTVVE